MGILQHASKALLIVALVLAPVTADDTPLSKPSPLPSKTAPSGKIQSNKAGRTNRQLAADSRNKRVLSVTRPQRVSETLFFLPNSTVEHSSESTEESGADQKRQRMRVVQDKAHETTGPLKDEPAPRPVQEASAAESSSVTPAVAETASDAPSEVQQVAGQLDEPFPQFTEAKEASDLSFDEIDLPEFHVQDSADDSGFEHDVAFDSQDEAAEPEISFEAVPSEFDVSAGPSDESDESTETTVTDAVTNTNAVPNTDGASLPSQHTGVQRPSVEVHWTRKGTLNVGQKSECALVVTNRGDSLVRNVSVEAAIPTGVDVVSAVPEPQPGTARWAVGDLAPGEARSIQMVMIPRQRGDVALNAFVRFTGYSTSVLTVQEPMLRTVLQGPESVTVGEQAGYQVRVENPGNGTAHNVVIEAQVPEGLQHRSGSVPRIHVGTLNAGESRQALLNLTALDGGEYQLAVRAIADGGLTDEARTTIMIARPSLEVSIAGPDTAAIGEPSNYQVTVTNTGNIPSINVRAKYRLPEDAQFVQADRGGVFQEADRLVDWFAGTIQPGESARYQVTLAAGAAGNALHRAGVKSEHTEISMVSHSTIVRGVPKLFLDVATAEPAPAIGEETIVRILVQNEGSMDAGTVGLICELPSGLEFVSAAGPSDFLDQNGVVIFRSIEAVHAGGEAKYLIRARCLRAGSHRVRVRVGTPSLPEPIIGEGTVTAEEGR
ncbi:MAG: hypothetical protein ABGZ35_05855 [Planctomycetaceae bacterium]